MALSTGRLARRKAVPEDRVGADRGVLARGLRLLAFLSAISRDRAGVREIASAIELPPSSTHRLLQMLAREDMVTRNHDGTYSVGLGFLRCAWKLAARYSVRDAAEPVLSDLASVTGETASLTIYAPSRHELMFVAAAESSNPFRYFIALNEWEPANRGASGMAICAHLPREERRKVWEHGRAPLTGPEFEYLEKAAEEVLTRSYAFSRGQRLAGAVGIAAPVFTEAAVVLGTIALSLPEQRFEPDREAELGALVVAAAGELTGRIGGEPPGGCGAHKFV